MAGTSPGFPVLRAVTDGSDEPFPNAFDAPDDDSMSSSPTVPPHPRPQRVERKPTPLPSLTAQSDARVQAAIAASARAEASLSGLFRALQHLGSGLGGAREANESLTQELEALRDMLGAANEQQLAYKNKVELLERALNQARADGERERKFLIDEHDAFIVDLLDEQEGELEKRDRDLHVLRGRLSEIERRDQLPTVPPPNADASSSARMRVAQKLEDDGSALVRAERAELERTAQKLAEDRERARETVSRLQAQRDEAQATVVRVTKERDDALDQVRRLKAELGGPRLPLSTRPPPVESRRPELPLSKPPALASKSGSELTLDSLDFDGALGRAPLSAAPVNAPESSLLKATAPAPALGSVVAPPRPNPLAAPAFAPAPRSGPQTSSVPRSNPQTSPTPRSNPLAAPPPARLSPPPDELRLALTSSPVLQPLGASTRPPLKQKPDVSLRPLVGYSLGDEEIEAEQIEGVRLSKPPPGKR
ncbi:MAG TPA: hypothetical protein VGM44_11510 [Polyangiaceae bacterium]|jgi:hypothetical protein